MNSADAGILSHPDPCSHIVYPYVDEAHLVDAVSLFTSEGLLSGEAVLLIVTAAHIRPILERLIIGGFDVQKLITSGQLVYKNAERLLASVMRDGIFDHARCETLVHEMLTRTRATVGVGGRIRVFGEMVDLIWRSQLGTTELVEQLWDEMTRKYALVLLCAYAVTGNEREALPPAMLACHSHVLAEA
jgi:hypothetical protein